MKFRFWAVLMALSLAAVPARADELPVFYKGIRPLGMGGAFTAVADDHNSMFYNPAGLNNIKGFGRVDLLNPYFEYSKNTLNFFEDVKDVGDADTDSEQAQLAADLMSRWMGKNLHLRTGVFPNVTMHNFGFGVLGQGYFDGEVHNPLGSSTLDVRFGYDVAAVASGALGFMESRVQVGITGKMVSRRIQERSYTTLDLVQQDGLDMGDLQQGNGFGVDLGVIVHPPVFLNPSLGLTVQNIGDIDLGDAGLIKQQVNLGLGLAPELPFGKLILALDLMDASRNLGEDDDTAKRLHAGVEYRFPVILAVRAGLHQGYPSFGLTADFWILKADYAFYIEEIGAYAGQRPDRRNVVQLSIGF